MAGMLLLQRKWGGMDELRRKAREPVTAAQRTRWPSLITCGSFGMSQLPPNGPNASGSLSLREAQRNQILSLRVSAKSHVLRV